MRSLFNTNNAQDVNESVTVRAPACKLHSLNVFGFPVYDYTQQLNVLLLWSLVNEKFPSIQDER